MRRHLLLVGVVAGLISFAWLGCGDGDNPSIYTPSEGGGGSGGSAVTGGKGVGEECADDAECRPGLACDGGTCQPAHSTEEGEACIISAECLDGLYCEGGVCAPAGTGVEGDECVTDADCASGFRCHLQGFSAVCMPEGEGDVGGACGSSLDCFGGLACVEGECAQLPPGTPPFGMPWEGVDCVDETDAFPVKTYFRVPRDGDTNDFFQLPYPNDVRLDGTTLDLTGFPTPGDGIIGYDVVQRYVDEIQATHDGWGMYSYVYFRFSNVLALESLKDNIRLVDLTNGNGVGIYWSYQSNGGKYMCNYRIAVGPYPGTVLTPGHTYAAYLTAGVQASDGTLLEVPADLIELLSDTAPSDPALSPHWPKYASFRQYLADNSIATGLILNAAVFTVGNPRATVEQLETVIGAAAVPTATQWTLCDTGVTSPCPEAGGERACEAASADFHELHALVELPIFQQGTAPYLEPADGGDIAVSGGVPVVQRTEQVCMSLTIPKDTMPGGGWPTIVYAHGTGGHFRSHVVQGLASDFAQGVADGQGNTVKAAMLGIDQVQHGPRRNSSLHPNDLFFNIANPKAAGGNPRQGAADQMALLRFVPTVTQDATLTGTAFNLSATVAHWGHSQGATVGGIAAPYGDWAGVVFSGQGGGLRDALVTKTSPVNIAGVVPFVLMDFTSDGRLMHGTTHVVLNLMQHFIDGADPIAFGNQLALTPPGSHEARHIFQPYGLNDTFTPSAVQANYALVSGLGLVVHDPSVSLLESIGWLDENDEVPVPASGNLSINGKTISAYVREYAQSDDSDGHFVVFDVASARGDAERFLAGSLSGVTPQVGE